MSTESLNMPFLMFRIVTVILKLTWSASEPPTVAILSLQKAGQTCAGYLRFVLTDVFLHTVNIGRLFLPGELCILINRATSSICNDFFAACSVNLALLRCRSTKHACEPPSALTPSHAHTAVWLQLLFFTRKSATNTEQVPRCSASPRGPYVPRDEQCHRFAIMPGAGGPAVSIPGGEGCGMQQNGGTWNQKAPRLGCSGCMQSRARSSLGLA